MTQRAVFIVYPGFSLTTLAVLTDAFFVANWQSGRPMYRWTVAVPEQARPRGFSNISVEAVPLGGLDPQRADIVLALSSFDPYGLADARGVTAFLRAAYRFGARIAGVETGSVTLARAGLLQGRPAAIHWANRDGFIETFPDIPVSDRPVERAGRCLTCAGASSAVDLALNLIEEDASPNLARIVSAHMLRPSALAQTGANAAPGPGDDTLVAAALRLMEENIGTPLSLPEIASRVASTQKTLERRFRRALGRTPGEHYLTLRLTRAQNLLQQTGLSVGEIAVDTGFESLPSFSRAYRARFGIAPSRDRVQTETAPVPRMVLSTDR